MPITVAFEEFNKRTEFKKKMKGCSFVNFVSYFCGCQGYFSTFQQLNCEYDPHKKNNRKGWFNCKFNFIIVACK